MVDSMCTNGFIKLEIRLMININKIINAVVNEYCTVLIKFWDTNKGFMYHEKIKKKVSNTSKLNLVIYLLVFYFIFDKDAINLVLHVYVINKELDFR